MMARARFAVVLTLALLLAGCAPRTQPPSDPELALELRWVKGYSGESRGNVETGLRWGLSFLGASLPLAAEPFRWRGNRLTLDLAAAGILPEARAAWIHVLRVMKESDEYRSTGALDIGRIMVLTLCSSKQYFALTGAASSFAQFQQRHPGPSVSAAVIESDIAHGNRLLEFGKGTLIQDLYILAYEGRGSLARGTFEKAEIETIDFMPNGQLRFGLYGLEGQLKAAASTEFTDAAKPSKCLWCHEIRLQPAFKNVSSAEGYVPAGQLRELIAARMRTVTDYRQGLRSQIDYRRTDDHTYAELLYLSFTEPTAERLAAEWNLPLAEVQRRVAGLPTHVNHEFHFLGESLYERAEIDRLAPFPALQVPTQIREVSRYEPDLVTTEHVAAASDAAP